MSKKLKIIVAVVAIVVLGLSVFFGCYYGIKPTVTLDYGYSITTVLLNPGSRPVVKEVEVLRGSRYVPERPTLYNHTFAGWYKDTALTVPWVNERVTSNITLYAKWVED